jgi:hypothetical protein
MPARRGFRLLLTRIADLVKVFITVDTEVWPDSPGWPRVSLATDNDCGRELSLYFYGGEGPSRLGVPYQLRTLADHGLKATYFIDPLFSWALGIVPLRDLVALIQERDQEIGLHLHPEWLTDPRCAMLPRFAGPLLHRYPEAAQSMLIRSGLERLRECGADRVEAFRAGSWGADLTTLRALASNGVKYDASLNACFAASFPASTLKRASPHPCKLEGVWEFPVTTFIDRPPRGRRPLHVCAASFGEFEMVLSHAAANDWFAVVIVLHSFEFVRVGRVSASKGGAPQKLLARRFERLCKFLAEHRDRFPTCHFADLDAAAIPDADERDVATSRSGRTALRMLEQLVSRVY